MGKINDQSRQGKSNNNFVLNTLNNLISTSVNHKKISTTTTHSSGECCFLKVTFACFGRLRREDRSMIKFKHFCFLLFFSPFYAVPL